MKKKSGKKWIMAAVTVAVCVMMAGCGDAEGEVKSGKASSGDTAVATSGSDTEVNAGKGSSDNAAASGGTKGEVTFKNAESWGYSGQNIWLFKDGKLAICVDTGENPKGEILEEIPYASIRSVCLNVGVKMEEDWFADCDNLVSVYGDVEEIAKGCFSKCGNLTSVELQNATTINDNAFDGCSSLTSIELPNATTINDNAFDYCSSLTSIELPNATEVDGFRDCSSLTSIELPNATEIDSAFRDCSSLTSVELPNVITIEMSAFEDCDSLTSIELPNVTYIGQSAFSGCGSLTSVEMP